MYAIGTASHDQNGCTPKHAHTHTQTYGDRQLEQFSRSATNINTCTKPFNIRKSKPKHIYAGHKQTTTEPTIQYLKIKRINSNVRIYSARQTDN